MKTVHWILVNNQLDAQFFTYVYFYSLHVSGGHVPIIRRIIASMRHLVYVVCRLHTRRSSTHTDINQVSHLYNNSPDDGHKSARNTQRIEINIHEKLCVKLVIYKDHTKMHDQQNIKYIGRWVRLRVHALCFSFWRSKFQTQAQ